MKLCIALDLPSANENLNLAKQIKDYDVWLKVGFRTFVRDGKDFIKELKNINPNFKIFLDLKLYDIPNTMATTALEIANLDIDMFNIHASSGKTAMKAVMDILKDLKNPPLVLAVTALTSFDNDEFKTIYNDDIQKKANSFALAAFEVGVHGVVCSTFESFDIKKNTSNNFITLCPGIRPFETTKKDDQKRVANIQKAKKELVDFIVVGRPIYNATNPQLAVKEILDKIETVK